MNVGSILVADDDKTCRDSIQKLLEKEGHMVQTVGDMESVLKTLATRHFDLVCDYTMPGGTRVNVISPANIDTQIMRKEGLSVSR